MERRYAARLRDEVPDPDTRGPRGRHPARPGPDAEPDVRRAGPGRVPAAGVASAAAAPRALRVPARRRARGVLARRPAAHHRVLFLAFTVGAVVAAVGGLDFLWVPAAPAVLLTLYIGHLRRPERRRFEFTMDRAGRPRRPAERGTGPPRPPGPPSRRPPPGGGPWSSRPTTRSGSTSSATRPTTAGSRSRSRCRRTSRRRSRRAPRRPRRARRPGGVERAPVPHRRAAPGVDGPDLRPPSTRTAPARPVPRTPPVPRRPTRRRPAPRRQRVTHRPGPGLADQRSGAPSGVLEFHSLQGPVAQSGSAPRSHRGGLGFESPQLHPRPTRVRGKRGPGRSCRFCSAPPRGRGLRHPHPRSPSASSVRRVRGATVSAKPGRLGLQPSAQGGQIAARRRCLGSRSFEVLGRPGLGNGPPRRTRSRYQAAKLRASSPSVGPTDATAK